jgi:hypothetical protein
MGAERKSLARGQNDALDPKRPFNTSSLDDLVGACEHNGWHLEAALRPASRVVRLAMTMQTSWSLKRWIVPCLRAREKRRTKSPLAFTFREHVRTSEDCRSEVQQINSSGWE